MSITADILPENEKNRRNRRVAIACVAFFSAMVGLAYASVPLYRLFCQVTGYGGTTQRAEMAPQIVLDQTINVRFDANTGPGMGWDFAPVQRAVTLKIGESNQVSYKATNILDRPVTGTATFNVTPQSAGAYFNKIQCFCFTETTLQPGESMDMPVVFFIDPAIVDVPELKDISTITLSYTFFPVEPTGQETTGVRTNVIAPDAAAPAGNDTRG